MSAFSKLQQFGRTNPTCRSAGTDVQPSCIPMRRRVGPASFAREGLPPRTAMRSSVGHFDHRARSDPSGRSGAWTHLDCLTREPPPRNTSFWQNEAKLKVDGRNALNESQDRGRRLIIWQNEATNWAKLPMIARGSDQ